MLNWFLVKYYCHFFFLSTTTTTTKQENVCIHAENRNHFLCFHSDILLCEFFFFFRQTFKKYENGNKIAHSTCHRSALITKLNVFKEEEILMLTDPIRNSIDFWTFEVFFNTHVQTTYRTGWIFIILARACFFNCLDASFFLRQKFILCIGRFSFCNGLNSNFIWLKFGVFINVLIRIS